ncbi:uncharacterized protein EI90DRAFT_568546 [Cantharellus anzutake]|uniref:uncharacterized protein n=1 Tax=Cantharellus anzutake TaxID=1750568 RepID=UPI00190432A8|nr:uncharacterized protein EI90DRAFT_568546 [Cantharellus anzutake]KAF8333516.1 hypothetical protein EI90DRAFT_568546 [Cantharellus anzutake]
MDETVDSSIPQVETLNDETEDYLEPEQEQTNEIESDPEIAETEAATATAADAAEPAPKKPKSKPPTERLPGQSLLPLSRVSKIMKADKELGTAAKEAIFLVAIATEEFIKRLGIEGHNQAIREGRSIVMLKDLVRRTDELLFLQDIIPHTITASAALTRRSKPEVTDPSLAPAAGSGSASLQKGLEKMRVNSNEGIQTPASGSSRRKFAPSANTLATMMQNARKGKGKELAVEHPVENGGVYTGSAYQLRPVANPSYYTNPAAAPLPPPAQLPPNARPPPPVTRSVSRTEQASEAMDTS